MQQRAREVVGRFSLPNAAPPVLQEVGAALLGLFQNAFEGLELAAHVSSNAVSDARPRRQQRPAVRAVQSAEDQGSATPIRTDQKG